MRIFAGRQNALARADIFGAIFAAHRQLAKALHDNVMAGTGFTTETAEILIELFLARKKPEPTSRADEEGYIFCRELLASACYSQGLFSRRITWLCDHGWAETKKVSAAGGQHLHGNCQKIRITAEGAGKMAVLWRDIEGLAEQVLGTVSAADLEAHFRVNETIIGNLETSRAPARASLVPSPKRKLAPPRPIAAAKAEPKAPSFSAPDEEFLD